MRRLRTRLTLSLSILVIVSGIVTLLMSALNRTGMILGRDAVRHLLFGFALRDMVLMMVSMAVLVVVLTVTSRSAANPVRQLSRAMSEIASGNFNVRLDLKDRVEEFGELQKNFNMMAQELKSNDYLRKDFISSVSHELKTPLSIMSGYASLLEEGGLPPEKQQEYAALIARQSERLVALTGNMLRLSRIDSQRIPTNTRRFSLDEQIRQTALLLEPKWTAADITMDLDLQTVVFSGDEELLAQIWQNLLDNAIKFTPQGGCVAISLTRDADGVLVRVKDNGPGMDNETRSRCFEQFFSGGASNGGSGLGLPLARRIAELHGGSIEVQSAVGEGSEFTVFLPQPLSDKTRR